MLRVEYAAGDGQGPAAGPSSAILGVIGYPDCPASATAVPRACVGMRGPDPSGAMVETWIAESTARRERRGDIEFAIAGDLLFGVVRAPESSGAMEPRTRRMYSEIFALLDEARYPHALRCWNYIPRINEAESGIERYRSFNVGRYAAFEAAGRLAPDRIPAASGLGTHDDALTVAFVASRIAGHRIENPRQVNAWRYPAEYGPRSPTFARAMAWPAASPAILFVSGTASIVGHRTLHAGDVLAQLRETFENLEAVFGEARRVAPFELADAALKTYVRRAEDMPLVQREVRARLGSEVNAVFLQADICRPDLLVEIEAFARADAAGDSACA